MYKKKHPVWISFLAGCFLLTTCAVIPPYLINPAGKKLYADYHLPDKIDEASGMDASAFHPDTYWLHNDSGDEARLFAISGEGRLKSMENGIRIKGAKHIDWEDLTVSPDGSIYIGDVGNNANNRNNLTIYKIREPESLEVNEISIETTFSFVYPDQADFPPVQKNFDCEAIFEANGQLYVLTKHRSDSHTKLYRIIPNQGNKTPAELLTTIEINGQVTAADFHEGLQELAVLTYNAIWLFSLHSAKDNAFTSKLDITALQCETICFSNEGDVLIITNEQGEMFRVKKKMLRPVENPVGLNPLHEQVKTR